MTFHGNSRSKPPVRKHANHGFQMKTGPGKRKHTCVPCFLIDSQKRETETILSSLWRWETGQHRLVFSQRWSDCTSENKSREDVEETGCWAALEGRRVRARFSLGWRASLSAVRGYDAKVTELEQGRRQRYSKSLDCRGNGSRGG